MRSSARPRRDIALERILKRRHQISALTCESAVSRPWCTGGGIPHLIDHELRIESRGYSALAGEFRPAQCASIGEVPNAALTVDEQVQRSSREVRYVSRAHPHVGRGLDRSFVG